MRGVSTLAAKLIAAHITAHLKLPSAILPRVNPPDAAYDKRRGQFDAAEFLQFLARQSFGKLEKIVAVTAEDIFVPIFTYIYGEAEQGGKFAVVSLFRLCPNPGTCPTPPVVFERAAKIAMHEIGHLFNLIHCDDEHCLMHFCGSLTQLDQTAMHFCRYCLKYFRLAAIR